jgi:hypothetical protein
MDPSLIQSRAGGVIRLHGAGRARAIGRARRAADCMGVPLPDRQQRSPSPLVRVLAEEAPMNAIARSAALLTLVFATRAFADSDGPSRAPRHGCHPQHYTIVDSPTTDNCDSPFGFCAAGVAEGSIHGTTFFTLDGLSPAPATAPGLGESSGILVYTTDDGTLTVRETGVGNMGAKALGGVGASLEQVIAGTGCFAGASGTLYLASEAHDGSYHASVTGELCWE